MIRVSGHISRQVLQVTKISNVCNSGYFKNRSSPMENGSQAEACGGGGGGGGGAIIGGGGGGGSVNPVGIWNKRRIVNFSSQPSGLRSKSVAFRSQDA